MKITVIGRVPHSTDMKTVTWIDGQLFGDEDAIAFVKDRAEFYEGTVLGIMESPHVGDTNHLADPYQTYALLSYIFDIVSSSTDVKIPIGGYLEEVPPDLL